MQRKNEEQEIKNCEKHESVGLKKSDFAFFKPPSCYLINEKKSHERELLLYANPLHGNKKTQKKARMSCVYHAYNYIRTRYKYSEDKHLQERKIEKIFSSGRRKLSDLAFFKKMSMIMLTQWIIPNYFKNSAACDQDELLKLLKRGGFVFSIKNIPKELNTHLVEELNQHFKQFADYLKNKIFPENSSKEVFFVDIEKHLSNYGTIAYSKLMLNILTIDLHFDFENLFFEFLQERNYTFSREEVSKIIHALDLDISNSFIEPIYFNQQAKLYDLSSLKKDITTNIDFLLNTLEKYGPLVCKVKGKITCRLSENFIKNTFGFPINEVKEFDEKSNKDCTHYVVLVGGGFDDINLEYVYYIDPNNEYSSQNKAPVYRISFEKFKIELAALDDVILIKNNEKFSMNRHYFLYGKNGLNLTRDPVSEKTRDTFSFGH